MAENIYDVAYDLEKLLREADEYKQLTALYSEVNGDPQAKQLFDDFRIIQLELQQKQMAGQEITQEEVEKAQQKAQEVQQNEKISQLMEVEQRMSVLVNQLNKIIMKPLEDLYGNMQ
ncbi:YlbF family regulator [Metabacillus fastidiosus]|uniref:UPF0342 protein P9271_03645 n=1 Tax=Metabacillus fastidiosus TaxID=1458 RepID=A0ABU6NTG5_9BACI|nr:YlbF family regulator [Metabacillus fastidiosus]MEC2077952.1 YlbF family regulator [Metabacillus fastidiosus]MED4400437.1 YlbF family regulator [Metabacillus fastidiosus]MED4454154.1 YlbF family regulator [Metabacillus fastidiosus]MED4464321.1 YlbF family regulator [Metabacillus fastidiosus]MED4531079.1 YlbF family regulator [Metabacillus fastidiosus]